MHFVEAETVYATQFADLLIPGTSVETLEPAGLNFKHNSQVELAAPGVGVLSTVPYLDETSLTVGGVTYAANHIEFSARGSASGALVNGGLCDSVGAWSGKVVLCERGVRTFADHTRNTLDLSIVPAVHRLSHLPILVDPSHGTGKRDKVIPLSRAGIAVGADGLIVEVHTDPDRALSDGPQSIYPEQFEELMSEVRQIAPIVKRTVPQPVAVAAAGRR